MKKGDFNAKAGGFTIIEVALVIAIAGLIFLMVFVALPALQRQSRDTRRREGMIDLVTAVKKYQANNRGALPTAVEANATDLATYNTAVSADGTGWKNFYMGYLGENFGDPDGGNYALRVEPCGVNVADQKCTAASLTGGNNVYDTSFPFTYGSNKYTILVVTQATCSGDQAVATANPRKIAVLYRLEGAATYCYNS